jgi:hypothetical protein
MLVVRKGIKMNRGLIAISVATIFLFAGIAAGYVQEDRKETPPRKLTGILLSVDNDKIKVQTQLTDSVRVIYFFKITGQTKIYGTLQEGKTVTITYRREGEGRRIIRFIALTIMVKE